MRGSKTTFFRRVYHRDWEPKFRVFEAIIAPGKEQDRTAGNERERDRVRVREREREIPQAKAPSGLSDRGALSIGGWTGLEMRGGENEAFGVGSAFSGF